MHSDVTILIKTFIRPAALRRLLKQCQARLPGYPIIVVDDGQPYASDGGPLPGNPTVLKMPFDSGISVGRNKGIDSIKTKFFVLLDDDTTFPEEQPVDRSLEIMRETEDWDVITYRMGTVGHKTVLLNAGAHFEIKRYPKTATREARAVLHRRSFTFPVDGKVYQSDWGVNAFIARTEVVKAIRWDDRLKVGEHWDFFYRCKLAKARVGVLAFGGMYNNHTSEGGKHYDRYRYRARKFHKIACRSHGFAKYIFKSLEGPVVDNFCIELPYTVRTAPQFVNHGRMQEKGRVYQPDVYPLAQTMLDEIGADRIVDLGCGDASKLSQIDETTEYVGVDIGPTIATAKEAWPDRDWRVADLNTEGCLDGLPLDGAVVVCADVIEHLPDPSHLLRALKSTRGRWRSLVLSTPDRDRVYKERNHHGPPGNPCHVREWTRPELDRLLAAYGLPSVVSWTRSEANHPRLHTLLAVCSDASAPPLRRASFIHIPKNAGRSMMRICSRHPNRLSFIGHPAHGLEDNPKNQLVILQDPVRRFESAVRWVIEFGGEKRQKPNRRRRRRLIKNGIVTPDKWVSVWKNPNHPLHQVLQRELAGRPGTRRIGDQEYPHNWLWCRQVAWIRDPKFIVLMENVAEEMALVFKFLGVNAKLPKLNATTKTHGPLSPENDAWLREYYRADCELYEKYRSMPVAERLPIGGQSLTTTP